MAVTPVTMRYVQALFAAAEKRGERPAVLAHLQQLDALLNGSVELKTAMLDRRVPVEVKRKVLDQVLLAQAPQLLVDFVGLCLARGRAEVLVEAAEEFSRLEREARGVIVARVQGVAPLSEHTRGAVKARLEEMTGKHVEMIEEVDPSLIGGLRIVIGSTMWDGSVRRRLDDIEKHLDSSPIAAT